MSMAYYATRDLCERYRCSSRTLFRRMNRARNPFPAPCIQHVGSSNLWDEGDVAAWEDRERASAKLSTERPGTTIQQPATNSM